MGDDAASRRESARASDGRFGHQHHAESDVSLSPEPGTAAYDAVHQAKVRSYGLSRPARIEQATEAMTRVVVAGVDRQHPLSADEAEVVSAMLEPAVRDHVVFIAQYGRTPIHTQEMMDSAVGVQRPDLERSGEALETFDALAAKAHRSQCAPLLAARAHTQWLLDRPEQAQASVREASQIDPEEGLGQIVGQMVDAGVGPAWTQR